MLRYIRNRLLMMIPVLLGMSVLVFVLMRVIPGDAAIVSLGTHSTPDALAAFRARNGLDRPLYIQYFTWLANFARGDFGVSVTTGINIRDELLNRLPVTLELTSLGVLIAILIGLPAGLIAATHQNSKLDLAVSVLGLTGLSIPNFWLGSMLVMFFAINIPIFPPSGFVPFTDSPLDNLRMMVLPAFSLGVVSASVIMRMTRSSVLEVVRQDYVRTARAKGAPGPVVTRRHVLKNSLIPVVTVAGMEAGYIFGAAFLIEAVFVIPGVATWSLFAVNQRDYPVLQATTMVIVLAFMMINLIVDIMYTYLDPRLRITGKEG